MITLLVLIVVISDIDYNGDPENTHKPFFNSKNNSSPLKNKV